MRGRFIFIGCAAFLLSPLHATTKSGLDTIIIPKVEFDHSDLHRVVDFLNTASKKADVERYGIDLTLEIPANWDYPVPSATLSLKNASLRKVLAQLCDNASLEMIEEGHLIVLQPKLTPAQLEGVARMTHKLASLIIIPNVNFEQLDISAVVDFLTAASKQYDPDHKGIKFLLRLPPGKQSPRFHRKVSVTLTDVPLIEVLGYVMAQTKLRYVVHPDAVIVEPPLPED